MASRIDEDRFPEWRPFADAVQARRPDAGTWCEAWTVRDIVAHQAGNAEELARVLGAHLSGQPVETRGFEEREEPLRALDDADLWPALTERMARLSEVAEAADSLAEDTEVAWTGRTMKARRFAEHMREELVLHGWDITGDDPAAQQRLGEPWMTDHSVYAVGVPLLARGVGELGLSPDDCIRARLRVDGMPDIAVTAAGDQTTIELVDPAGDATLETDAAARVLLLWGRRPADPSRICSSVGPQALGQLRNLLSGY
ncbi:MAG: maleylpyruvate isomerase N-terminal domain-containing protein [Acidimicrobiaceae bacterium]|nr:maleylpyruvate isomerase N-terminal domain-containing protein [Acidimicrobiaceae bacterium]